MIRRTLLAWVRVEGYDHLGEDPEVAWSSQLYEGGDLRAASSAEHGQRITEAPYDDDALRARRYRGRLAGAEP